MKMPFGEYKDQDIEQVPVAYLEWLVGGNVKIELWFKNDINDELARRDKLNEQSTAGKIITESEDQSIQSLYNVIRKMPESLFNRPLILNKQYRLKVERV